MQTELLDRTSHNVIKIVWHPSGSYYLRYLNSIVELVELDSRDVRNSAFIATVNSDIELEFDKRGSELFMLTPHVNQLYTIQ
jgi:hypothetical protein